MKVSLIKFVYTDLLNSDFHRINMPARMGIGVAILIYDGRRNIVVTKRPSGIEAFEIIGKDHQGKLNYYPDFTRAILPEREWIVLKEYAPFRFPENMAQVLIDSVEFKSKLLEANALANLAIESEPLDKLWRDLQPTA